MLKRTLLEGGLAILLAGTSVASAEVFNPEGGSR